jgi:hypothetical protein
MRGLSHVHSVTALTYAMDHPSTDVDDILALYMLNNIITLVFHLREH